MPISSSSCISLFSVVEFHALRFTVFKRINSFSFSIFVVFVGVGTKEKEQEKWFHAIDEPIWTRISSYISLLWQKTEWASKCGEWGTGKGWLYLSFFYYLFYVMRGLTFCEWVYALIFPLLRTFSLWIFNLCFLRENECFCVLVFSLNPSLWVANVRWNYFQA